MLGPAFEAAKSGDSIQPRLAVLFDASTRLFDGIHMQSFENQLHQLLRVNRF